jgi:hypothetical protein
MRLRTLGGVGGKTGERSLEHEGVDVALLVGLALDMKDAGNVQGLLTKGRSSVVLGVWNLLYSSNCCLEWLLHRAKGGLPGAIDITIKSLHRALPPIHRQWAPLYKRLELKRQQCNKSIVSNS